MFVDTGQSFYRHIRKLTMVVLVASSMFGSGAYVVFIGFHTRHM